VYHIKLAEDDNIFFSDAILHKQSTYRYFRLVILLRGGKGAWVPFKSLILLHILVQLRTTLIIKNC